MRTWNRGTTDWPGDLLRVGDLTCVSLAELLDLAEAMEHGRDVAHAAVDYKRRTDMCISEFNHVRLTVVNRRHAGLTPAESRLAAKIDAFLAEDEAADA